jgi:hypothetical protein
MEVPGSGGCGTLVAGWFLGGLVPRHIPAITTSQFDDPSVGFLGAGGGPRRIRGGGGVVVVSGDVELLPPPLAGVESPLEPEDPGVEVLTRMVTWLSLADPSMLRHSPAFLSACEQSAKAGIAATPSG